MFEHALIAFFEIVKTEDIKDKLLETFRTIERKFLDENLGFIYQGQLHFEISIFEVNYFDLQTVCPSLTIFFFNL